MDVVINWRVINLFNILPLLLPFEILSFMNTISSDVEINEYKLLGTESNKIS